MDFILDYRCTKKVHILIILHLTDKYKANKINNDCMCILDMQYHCIVF